MKKLFALLLAMMMVFTLAACGGGNDTPDPSGSGTTDPAASQQQDGTENDSDTAAGEDDPAKTGWWTKPYHLKLNQYNLDENTAREIEVLFDGEEILLWLGNNGEYTHMLDGALWNHSIKKDDPSYHYASENEYHESVLDYMESSAYPGGMLNDYNKFTGTPDMWKSEGAETVEGFNCTFYSAEYNDGTVKLWIDESKGVVIKREAPDPYDDGKTALDYVVTSFVTENVPSVSSVYQPPNDDGKPDAEDPSSGKDKWPDNDFTKQVPKPDFPVSSTSVIGNLFNVILEDVSADELRAYAEKVKEAGFTIDPQTTDAGTIFQYSAYNEAGYWVLIGSHIIRIEAPKE